MSLACALEDAEPVELRDLAGALARLARAAKAASACVQSGGDLPGTLVHLRDATRLFQRANARLEDKTVPATTDNLRCLVAMREAFGRARASLRRVRSALEKAAPDSPGAMADFLLGVWWKHDRDPALLAGRETGPIVAELRQRGLKRIAVFDPDGKPVEGALVVPNPYHCRAAIAHYGWPAPERVIWRILDATIPPADLAIAKDMVQEAVDGMRVSNNTIDLFGEVWALQGMVNLPHIGTSPKIRMYETAFAGKPAVIVATGPSLSKNVHLLKQLKGRALIISFSHTLKAVQAAGVDPDVVLALDPEDLRYHFDGCDTSRIEAMILGATVHPGVFDLPRKRLITFCANNHVDAWIDPLDSNVLSTGGSVACSALAMAHWFGCSPILFIGQDLAFTGGRVYAHNTVDDQAVVLDHGPAFQISGWSKGYSEMASVAGAMHSGLDLALEADGWWPGTKVRTSTAFTMYRKWIECYLSQHGITAWNCTEGGARIANAEHMSLFDALERLPSTAVDAGAVFDAPSGFDREASQAKMIANISGMIERTREAVRIVTECQGMALARRAEDGPALFAKSKELQRYVDRIPFIVMACQKHLASHDDVDNEDIPAVCAAALENYALVLEKAKEILPRLEQSLLRLQGDLPARTAA